MGVGEAWLTIASKDTDFHQRAIVFGHPPKVIGRRKRDRSNLEAFDHFRPLKGNKEKNGTARRPPHPEMIDKTLQS